MSCWLSSLRIFLLAAILSALTENASDNCVFFIYLLVVFCIFVHPHCLNDNENWQCGWFEEDRFCIRRQNEQPREPLPLWYCVSHRLDRIYNSLSLSGHHWRHLRQTLSCATVYQTKATRQDGCFPVNRAHRTGFICAHLTFLLSPPLPLRLPRHLTAESMSPSGETRTSLPPPPAYKTRRYKKLVVKSTLFFTLIWLKQTGPAVQMKVTTGIT